jgi:gluconate 2-dehydrogenase subunit 3-like protein
MDNFFTQLKQTTAFAYYSSSIGIHQEMNYKGNVLLTEFQGYDAT